VTWYINVVCVCDNSNVRNATVNFAMIDMIKNPPVGFEYPVLAHFYMNRDAIIKQVEAWCQDGVSKTDKLTTLKVIIDHLLSPCSIAFRHFLIQLHVFDPASIGPFN
jgi:hypothetical protein